MKERQEQKKSKESCMCITWKMGHTFGGLVWKHIKILNLNSIKKINFVNLYSAQFHDKMVKYTLQYGDTLQIESEFGNVGF